MLPPGENNGLNEAVSVKKFLDADQNVTTSSLDQTPALTEVDHNLCNFFGEFSGQANKANSPEKIASLFFGGDNVTCDNNNICVHWSKMLWKILLEIQCKQLAKNVFE